MDTDNNNPSTSSSDADAARARFLESMGIPGISESMKPLPSTLDSQQASGDEAPGKDGDDEGLVLSSSPDDVELPGATSGATSGARVVNVQVSKSVPKTSETPAAKDSLIRETDRSAGTEFASNDVPPPLEPVVEEAAETLTDGIVADDAVVEEMPPPLEPEEETSESVSFSNTLNAGVLSPAAGSDSGTGAAKMEEEGLSEDSTTPREEDFSDSQAEAEAKVDPVAETPADPSGNFDMQTDSLQLHCPKCDGELVLRREHLGVEGACVWCGVQIVAAKSGLDSQVRVFPVFQPSQPSPATPQNLSPSSAEEMVETPTESALDSGNEDSEKETPGTPLALSGETSNSNTEVSTEEQIDSTPEAESGFPAQAAPWSGMSSSSESSDSLLPMEGDLASSIHPDSTEEFDLPEMGMESVPTNSTLEDEAEQVDAATPNGFLTPEFPPAENLEGLSGEANRPAFEGDSETEPSAIENGFGNPALESVPVDPASVSFGDMPPSAEASEQKPSADSFFDGVPENQGEEIPEGFSTAFDRKQSQSEGEMKPLPGTASGISAESASDDSAFSEPPAPMGFGELIENSDLSSSSPANDSTPESEDPGPSSFFSSTPAPTEEMPEEKAASVSFPADDGNEEKKSDHVDMPEPGSAAGGFAIPSSTGLESFSGFGQKVDEEPTSFDAMVKSDGEPFPSPAADFPASNEEADAIPESFPTSWGSNTEETETKTEGEAESSPVENLSNPAVEEPETVSSQEVAEIPTSDSDAPAAAPNVEKASLFSNAGASTSGGSLFASTSASDSSQKENEIAGEQDAGAPVSNVEKSPIGEISAPAPDNGKTGAGRKPRKGLVIFLVILIGFVSGAAAASFFLPVEKYVLKAQAFMESKFNPGAAQFKAPGVDAGAVPGGMVEPSIDSGQPPVTPSLPAATVPQTAPAPAAEPQN